MALRVDRVNLQIILEEQRKGDALEKMNADIREQKRLVDQLAQRRERVMESYGNDPEAEAVKSITAQYEQARKRLQELDQKKGEYISSTKMETMNMYQLRQELKYYQGILKGLSPDTEVFRRTQGYVAQLKGRLKELNGEVSKTGGSFKLFGSSGKSSLLGLAENFNHISFAVKHVIALASKLKDAFVAVYNYFEPMAKAAMELEGIERAFKRINQPGMLDNLRAATHGTVSDLELMKQAVKFKDFNLPVEQLGTYLAFAQQKAKDTGESIDYLVNSIVTGLGRQSPLILDNLGLSAKQISEEAKRSGDFFGAVATIIKQRMSESGDYVETFAERSAQAEVRLKNAQLELGRAWLPVKESIDSTFTDLQIGVIDATKWLIEHRKIVYSLTAAMVAYSAAVKIYTAIQNGANISLDLFNKLSKKNIFGLIMAGIAAAIPWIISFISRTKEAASAQEELAAAEREASKSAASETAKLKTLYGATQDVTKSEEERLAAVKKLKSEYPTYFGYLSNEAILAGKAAAQYQQLTSDILAAAKARAYQKKIDKLAEENADLDDQIEAGEKWLKEHNSEFSRAWEKRQGIAAGDGLLAKLVARGSGGYTVRRYQEKQDEVGDLRRLRNANESEIQKLSDKVLANQPATDRLSANSTFAGSTTPTVDGPKNGSGSGKDDPYQVDLAALEKNRREALNVLKQSLVEGSMTEAEYQEAQKAQQMAFLQGKLALEKQYGKDTSQTEGELLDQLISEANAEHQRQLAEERENEQARLQQRREMLQQMEQAEKDALTGGNYAEALFQAEMMYSLDLINFEEYQKKKEAIEEAALKASLDREMKSAVKSGDFEGQLSVLEQQLSAKLITQEQYEDALTDITERQEARRAEIRDEFAQRAQQLMQDTSALFSALQSREEKRVDDKYKKLIASAKKQGKDTTKLEEQQEQEKLEIKKKYADKQFLMNVLNIMANTALGITKTIAEWGMPWAVPFVAMTAASGAVQLATAKAQRDQAAGLYTGGYSEEYVEGYTADGDPKEVAGAIPVHKREFVVNHEALKLPMIRRVTDVIDSMQKRRVYSMTDATAELQRAVGAPPLTLPRGGGGLSEGGYSSGVQEFRSSDGGETVGRLVPLMERNNALLDEIIESGITILELRRQIRRQEQLEKNASR